MNKICIVLALVAAFAHAEEPFSIGLGVLSPSYSQTVGKENVKVNFEQKDNGFSYSVGDPKSGSRTFLNFGSAASSQAINPAGYADANPSGYASVNPSGYASVNPSGYASVNPSGYADANPSGYAGSNPSSYTGPNPSAYAGPSVSGYAAPQANPSYNAYAGYQSSAVGAGSNLGYGASGFGSVSPGNLYSGSSGLAGLNNNQVAAPIAPVAPTGYQGETARKPEEPSQILPAGFSYHGTEGQSFLRQGDSPNFIISDESQGSARGPAEQSFYHNFRESGSQGSGKVLANGLVGFGSGGPRGSLPVGGYAGPQFAGLVKEHGGHE